MIITRKEARDDGLKYYFTGEPCEKGHVAERLTISSACLECVSERNEAFLEDKGDKAENKIAKRVAREARKESLDKELQMYRDDPDYRVPVDETQFEGLDFLPRKRREAAAIGSAQYYTDKPCHKGHMAPRVTSHGLCVICQMVDSRKKRLTNPEKQAAYRQNRRARKFAAGGSFTANDVKELYVKQNATCNGCQCDLAVSGYHIDHIMPLILMGSNSKENIQLLCPKCNLSKGGMTPSSWRDKIERERRASSGKEEDHHIL